MGKQLKKLKISKDKYDLKKKYGIMPEHKCPKCKKYSLFKREYIEEREKYAIKCIKCDKILRIEK